MRFSEVTTSSSQEAAYHYISNIFNLKIYYSGTSIFKSSVEYSMTLARLTLRYASYDLGSALTKYRSSSPCLLQRMLFTRRIICCGCLKMERFLYAQSIRFAELIVE